MKPIAEKSRKRAAFTIIELLTVMSVIILLMGLLVPALNMIKKLARTVTQKKQFDAIGVALETYNAEWGEYPESWGDGAVMLCEAMVGRDLMGYDPTGNYAVGGDYSGRRLYLTRERANAFMINCLYPTVSVADKRRVLCDTYVSVSYYNRANPNDKMNGRFVGMPVLYYKADKTKDLHVYSAAAGGNAQNIYNCDDNLDIIDLGMPGTPYYHAMGNPGAGLTPPPRNAVPDPAIFYEKTRNDRLPMDVPPRPHREDSYILISAGFDAEYGTNDDVFNFGT